MSIEQHHFTDVVARTFSRSDRLIHSDVRDRHIDLRNRFAQHGANHLSDAELLELLLLHSQPREDTRTLAKDLLAKFGDFSSVVSAPIALLEDIAGATCCSDLKLMQAGMQRLAKGRIRNKPLISSWDSVLEYCRTTLSHEETEQFRVLFLDRRNILIADELLGAGTVDHVPVYPREVLKRALELNACALILIHNHPSGDPTPSDADIAMTQHIKQAAGSLSITLHDHLIVGATTEVSLVNEGLL